MVLRVYLIILTIILHQKKISLSLNKKGNESNATEDSKFIIDSRKVENLESDNYRQFNFFYIYFDHLKGKTCYDFDFVYLSFQE